MLKFNKKICYFIITLFALATFSFGADNCKNKVLKTTINNSVPLIEVLNELGKQCDFIVLTNDNEAKRIVAEDISSFNIKDKTLNEIFKTILLENNLDYTFKDNILKVSALSTKIFKIDYITSVREGRANLKASADSSNKAADDEGSNTDDSDNYIKTTEKFDFWSTVKDEVKTILNNGMETFVAPDPIINPNSGLVTVTGTPNQLKRVENYINKMTNRLKKQVLLDVNIVEVTLDNEYRTGIDWSKFELGFSSKLGNFERGPGGIFEGIKEGGLGFHFEEGKQGRNFSHDKFAISANLGFNIVGMMNFLETKGKAKSVSSPKVMTMNNQQALITVGLNRYYVLVSRGNVGNDNGGESEDKEQYVQFVGILLNILPQISDNGKIMLRVTPSLSQLVDKSEENRKDADIAANTTEKKLTTVVEVNDGDTVILGGLIQQIKDKSGNSVPVLSAIPLVGNLFKSSHDTLQTKELIFTITPHIIDLSKKGELKNSLKDLGYSKSIYYAE